MPFAWAAGAAAIGGIASSVIGSNAASDAASTQAAASDKASQVQLDMFNRTKADEAPFVAAGGNALTQLMSGIGIGGNNPTGQGPLNAPFTMDQFQHSPGYQFQQQEGQDAVLHNASRTGGVNSGNTLKALTSYGQGVANQDYWNAYNAYVNRQNQQFGQLQTVAGSGQNAAANLGALGTQVGSNVGNNIIGAGNASAAGQVGSANAISNGISNVTGGLSQNYLLYSLLNGSGSGGGGGSGGSGPLWGDTGTGGIF